MVTIDDDGLAVVPGVGVVELDTRNGVWPLVGGATVVVVERR